MFDRVRSAGIVCMSGVLSVLMTAGICLAAGADYAALPPYLSAAVKPNVILVMDYSGSMQGQAYYGTQKGSPVYESSRVLNYGPRHAVEDHYDSGHSYYGYFDPDAYYQYNDAGAVAYWEVDDNTPYSGAETGDADSLSGNFLNFLVTSRMDAALESLIGGKRECPDGEDYCLLKPQGANRWVTVSNLDADCHVRPENYQTGDYADKEMLISIEDRPYSSGSTIGTFGNRYANVKIDARDRQGIIPKNFDDVRFAFVPYANKSNDAGEGVIGFGTHERDPEALVSALESAVPYGGTHTGEAMREAYRYLKQENMASENSAYQGKGTAIDPYYAQKEDGTPGPAWCRKSYVVLISDGEWNGDIDPDGWAYSLYTEDLRSGDGFADSVQNADVYTVFAFTEDDRGENAMKATAAFGSYVDMEGCPVVGEEDPYGLDMSVDSTEVVFPVSGCDPDGTYHDCCRQWDKTGDGIPDAFFDARDGEEMNAALGRIFREIRKGSASGTSVTALTSRATTGSLFTQAAFYPEKAYTDGHPPVQWTGNLFAGWYLNTYIDANLVQNIREDTDGDFLLDVEADRILHYRVEQDVLQVHAYESGSDGKKAGDDPVHTYSAIEDVAHLIDAGEKLKERDASSREIYGVSESGSLEAFTGENRDAFTAFLGTDTGIYPDCLVDTVDSHHENVIRYTRGEAVAGCRTRVADISGNTWKLGDIISSSPTVMNYGDYRMIFAGSNSGMLHAFRMGHIQNRGETLRPAELWDDDSLALRENIGREEWAFIPKNAMPYLRYMADPGYEHLYTVDLRPYIADTGDMIVLIGGMRLGGACGNGPISPPADTNPVGLSAYFALDVTDPENPGFLWEFTDPGLGLTYSGPAVVRRRDGAGQHYNHYVIFASGPTNHDGTSVQELLLYVLDLETGQHIRTFDGLNINRAYGGRLFTNGFDENKDGQTDFVFLGYTDKADQTDGRFDKMEGGIIKIHTGHGNPAEWQAEVYVPDIEGNAATGPVKIMDCFPDILPYPYLYFGTGRYFVPDDRTQGGPNDRNHLYGVPFTCDSDNICATGSISNIGNASDVTCDDIDNMENNPANAAWKIELDPAAGHFLRERCYSEPATTDYDIVLYNTMKPTDVICECGGKSRAWAVNCATGRGLGFDICPEIPENDYMVDPDIAFTFLVQLSGSDIHEYGGDDFDEEDTGATEESPGVPGDDGGTPVFPPGFDDITYWKQR